GPGAHDRGGARRGDPRARAGRRAGGSGGRVTERLTAREQELLEERLRSLEAAAGPPAAIPPRDPSRPARLSFAQTRLWFFDQLLPGSALYNISFAARLRCPLDARAVRRAIRHVVARHEAL